MKKIIFLLLFYSTILFSQQINHRVVTIKGDGILKGLNQNLMSVDFTGGSGELQGILTFNHSEVYSGEGCLENNNFCVGDKVFFYNESGLSILGSLEGFKKNKRELNFIIKSKKKFIKKDFTQMTFNRGCLKYGLDHFCVGESAQYKSFDGTIVGINSANSKITIHFAGGASVYSGYGTYNVAFVTVAKGCLEKNKFCVGQRAFAESISGQIVGINKLSKLICLQGETSNHKKITKTFNQSLVTIP